MLRTHAHTRTRRASGRCYDLSAATISSCRRVRLRLATATCDQRQACRRRKEGRMEKRRSIDGSLVGGDRPTGLVVTAGRRTHMRGERASRHCLSLRCGCCPNRSQRDGTCDAEIGSRLRPWRPVPDTRWRGRAGRPTDRHGRYLSAVGF